MLSAIIVACIAGVVSLLSALFAWKQTVLVKRVEAATQERLALVNAQTQAAIETIKTEHERSKNAFEVAIAESGPVEQALSTMWGLIQGVKDQVAATVRLDESKVDRETLTELAGRVKEARSTFLDIYQSSGAALPDTAADAAHGAKNIFFDIAMYTQNLVAKGGFPRRLSDEDVRTLWKQRELLTSCQRVIASERSDIRMRQFHKYLDILLPSVGGKAGRLSAQEAPPSRRVPSDNTIES